MNQENAEHRQRGDGLVMTPELIDEFICDLSTRGRTDETCNIYRRKLNLCRVMLGEDKTIRAGTLLELRRQLQEQNITNGGVNLFVSSVNNFLDYCGKRELQVGKSLGPTNQTPPELNRSEYLRLLTAAKQQKSERAYLLVKLFVNTGLNIRELSLVTLSAVRVGYIDVPERGRVYMSPCLCKEILAYCAEKGIDEGEVFVTSSGTQLSRKSVNAEIRRLATDADVAEEKCNPITLRRLYLSTHDKIMESLTVVIQQSIDRLFDTEQVLVGWSERA